MHKTNKNRVDPELTPLKSASELGFGKPNGSLRTIDQLSHDIVSTWVTGNSIRIRPSQKAALKALIANEVLRYIAADSKPVANLSPEFHFERGRLTCIEAIANINEEPFTGFICKQRALNACIQMPEE